MRKGCQSGGCGLSVGVGVWCGGDRVAEPGGVGEADVGGVEGEDLGDVVGVEGSECGLERIEGSAGGLNKGEDFGGGLHLALPAVDGFDSGEEIDAGGEL